MKVLFLVPYPTEGASNRIRVEQYIPILAARGITVKVRPFVNRRFYKILYLRRSYFTKAFWFIICTLNRVFDIVRSLGYDLIFIHREAYPFGGPVIESILHKLGKPIIFDFDDAIFLPNTSEYNIYIERFKRPAKIAEILEMSSKVIAGNSYLKDYALKYNKDVTIIPSSIDTKKYVPSRRSMAGEEIVIGWIGSNTTKMFLYGLEDVFVELSDRYGNIRFKIVGAALHSQRLYNVINKTWSMKDEIADLQSFDIGVMPMPNNAWTKGKCGMKMILYMSVGIPVVSSKVGVNKEMITDGVNGFLASTDEEWVTKLSALIEDEALRRKIGDSGRRTVEALYSIEENSKKFIEVLDKAYRGKVNDQKI